MHLKKASSPDELYDWGPDWKNSFLRTKWPKWRRTKWPKWSMLPPVHEDVRDSGVFKRTRYWVYVYHDRIFWTSPTMSRKNRRNNWERREKCI